MVIRQRATAEPGSAAPQTFWVMRDRAKRFPIGISYCNPDSARIHFLDNKMSAMLMLRRVCIVMHEDSVKEDMRLS